MIVPRISRNLRFILNNLQQPSTAFYSGSHETVVALSFGQIYSDLDLPWVTH